MLEVKGRYGDFENPYDRGYETSGFDNPKNLLQLEKANGLNIEEFEEIIGLDTSQLHQEIFVATYEIEDEYSEPTVMKPIKEYYQKGENGELEIIGTGTDEMTSFVVDGFELDVKSDQIIQGESEKITQSQLRNKLIKDGIEESMNNGKVTQVAQLTDDEFLSDFAKQCGIAENTDLHGRTFIVSTINEKGEEDFDIIIRNDPDTKYEQLEGIEATNESNREIRKETEMTIPGGAKILETAETLKEFETKSGHRYTVTKNKEGKIGLDEIFKENENDIRGQSVNTYSTDDLSQEYINHEINQEDVERAYETMNRTKEERTQNTTEEKDFEGR